MVWMDGDMAEWSGQNAGDAECIMTGVTLLIIIIIIIIILPFVYMFRIEFKNWDNTKLGTEHQFLQSGAGKVSCDKTAL